MRRQPPPAAVPRPVDYQIWRACVGISFQIHTVNSRVYYFPPGHVEHSCCAANYATTPSLIPCLVSAVHLLADPISDEVFIKLELQPVTEHSRTFQSLIMEQQEVVYANGHGDDDEVMFVSCAKILTSSDANNGGGFSVPRSCADTVFPQLNFKADPPVQTLSVADVQGNVWEFRHIYRGTPLRHLLTTGWSKFVNSKRLIAKDSVVFMRNKIKGEMFIGVRRDRELGHGGDSARWGGARAGRAEAVREATERAMKGLPFKVVYYPSSGWSDFVVRADVVESSLNVIWSVGMRVKRSVETEDSSQKTWFQGTVKSLPESGSSFCSPWRMLQVSWDEREALKNAERVSPWQVELLSPIPQLHSPNHQAKKPKYAPNSGLLTDGNGGICFPMTGFNSSTMGQINLSLLNCHSFPAGMQGARHDPNTSCSLITDFISENTSQGSPDNFSVNNAITKSNSVSTELNIASSRFDKLSPDNQASVPSDGLELLRNQDIDYVSFQLFGKSILIKKPLDGSKGSTRDADSNTYSTEDDGVSDLNDNSLDLSSAKPYLHLLDNLDVNGRDPCI